MRTVESHAAAERCAEELRQMSANIAARLDIQLGGLLSRRAVKAGELVGSWQGARPLPRPPPPMGQLKARNAQFSDGHAELTKAEFIKGVRVWRDPSNQSCVPCGSLCVCVCMCAAYSLERAL